jgi:hypothetical protein
MLTVSNARLIDGLIDCIPLKFKFRTSLPPKVSVAGLRARLNLRFKVQIAVQALPADTRRRLRNFCGKEFWSFETQKLPNSWQTPADTTHLFLRFGFWVQNSKMLPQTQNHRFGVLGFKKSKTREKNSKKQSPQTLY